jgi:very-short-patch-repair endonuclease
MLHYNPRLKHLARALRKQSTLSEVLLWRHLKGRQRRGVDFHRQKPIDEFIIDFFASQPMLAVEIDGDTHRFKGTEDLERQRKLETLGIRFLRFGDRLVKTNINCVVRTIDDWIEAWEKQEKRQW